MRFDLFSYSCLGGGPAPKTRLVVRHRQMNALEEGEMTRRLQLLEPLEEEESEEEEEEPQDQCQERTAGVSSETDD